MHILKKTNPLALLLVIVAMHYLVGGIVTLPNIWLGVLYLVIFVFYVINGGIHIEYKWLLFLLYLPLTIILAQPASIFRSWERYVLFALLFLICSPVLQSYYTRKFRLSAYLYVLIISILLSVGSFIGYFLGINFCTNDSDYIVDYVGVAGHFSGLTRQSMFLGPLSGISSVFLFYKYLSSKDKIWLLLFIPCMGSMFYSSSRSAFLATIAGLLTVLYYFVENKKEFCKKLLIALLLVGITFPLWKSVTLALQDKQNMHKDDTGLFDSRSGKVEQRFEEFISSPIWGVGFAAIDANGKDPYNRNTGTVEPGSSWLAVLSMTGLIGFILFSMLFKESFVTVRSVSARASLTGILVFYAVHMLVEGYIYAAGNPNTFIVWLIIGCCYDVKNASAQI